MYYQFAYAPGFEYIKNRNYCGADIITFKFMDCWGSGELLRKEEKIISVFTEIGVAVSG